MEIFDLLQFGGLIYFAYIAMIVSVVLLMVIYIFPLIQLFIANEKRDWLKLYFQKIPAASTEEERMRANLLIAAEPAQKHPMYKLLKFYLMVTGIAGVVGGLLIVILPERMDSDFGTKILTFVPLLVGVSAHLFYKKVAIKQRIWKEVSGFLLIVGFTYTMLGEYALFDLGDWLRSDLFLYIVLTVALIIVHHTKAKSAGAFYLILVASGATFVDSEIGYNWMMFFKYFLWLFAFASLSFWKPLLEDAKNVEFVESVYGLLFVGALLSLSMNATRGLQFLMLSTVIPYLYIFSKINYKKATWFGARIIEIVVVGSVIAGGAILSTERSVRSAYKSITLIDDFSFHKLVGILVAVIIGLIALYHYSSQKKEDSKAYNSFILLGPIVTFVLVYTLREYGTQYVMSAGLIALGIYYIQKGVRQKLSYKLVLGVLSIIISISIRLVDVFEEIDSKFLTGFIVMVLGALLFGIAMYMRSQWTVTDEEAIVEPNGNARIDAEIE